MLKCLVLVYYKLNLKEVDKTESPQFFGWKDFKQSTYLFISPWKQAVEICFLYGISIEEKFGEGKLVGFTLENYIGVTNLNMIL